MQPQSTIEQDLAEVRRIVLSRLKGRARVYLYGSRARGAGAPSSDIDVGVLPAEPLPIGLLSEVREALEDSAVPYSVELVDLSETDEAFRSRVLSEAVEWTG